MSKFKVGDRVKYGRIMGWGSCPDGFIGEVVELEKNGDPVVLWENGDQSAHNPDYVNVVGMESQRQALTGGSSDYYKLEINGLVIECNDIIKALGLNFAQGNVFKAVWRIGADNIGKGKPGNTRLYNAEKVVFFGNDMVEMEKAQANG